MRTTWWRAGSEILLPLVLGLTDGILTALTLATARIMGSSGSVALGVGLRIAVAALVTGAFTMYVAKYAELRHQLVDAGRQLNVAGRGHMASTRLGGTVRREAIGATIVAGLSSFVGALIPIVVGSTLHGPSWTPVAFAIVVLGTLGCGLGATVAGSKLRWSLGLAAGGLVVAVIGSQLHIV